MAVNQRVLFELFPDALQPTALGLGPCLRGKDRLHGVADAFLKRFQGRVEDRVADVADDGGSDLFVFGFSPSHSETRFAVPVFIQFQL